MGATKDWAKSKSKRRCYLHNVIALDTALKRIKQDNWQVTFTEKDAKLIADNGNDHIVIFAAVGDYNVNRILIDNGNAVEILQ